MFIGLSKCLFFQKVLESTIHFPKVISNVYLPLELRVVVFVLKNGSLNNSRLIYKIKQSIIGGSPPTNHPPDIA